ncbi:MAG: thioredoxin domain-containing protein [Gloeobacteraceae cyanobacterium ES-bin-144]|nr:thioredoxin domain-containing protein [Verrucomicrobiales bacterium]
MKHEDRSHGILDFLILTLALLGFGINLFLLFQRFSDAAVNLAGCGGSSCDEVFASRWSLVFGLPVAAFGMLIYVGLMISILPRFHRFNPLLTGSIFGAALWFVFAQFVLIGKICPWCMAAHGVGCCAFILCLLRFRNFKNIALWSIAAFLGIGLAQVYGPLPQSHRIENLSTTTAQVAVAPKNDMRMAVFNDGRKTYEVSTLPLLGSADAKHVMVEYFDYQCAACQTMAGYIDALIAKHPADVSCLLLPMPLDGVCNAHVTAKSQHPGSCEMARIALAVWREKPAAFPAFHRALITDASVDSAKKLAGGIIADERLTAVLSDPWIDSLLQSNIADWQEFSTSTDKLPKLLIRDKRILQGLPPSEEEFLRIMKQELAL